MNTKSRSERLYALLLKCFPQAYQEDFGEPMLCAFRDMLEQQPAWVVWSIALKELPGNLIQEYLSAFKGDLAMKRTTLSKGILSGFILGACWLLVTLLSMLSIITHVSFSLWGSALALYGTVLITPFLYGVGGFLCGRDSQRVQEGVYAGLLTASISTLMFLLSAELTSVLIRQIKQSSMAFVFSFVFFNVQIDGTVTRSSLVFFFTSLFVGAVFGLIGWLLGTAFSRRKVAA